MPPIRTSKGSVLPFSLGSIWGMVHWSRREAESYLAPGGTATSRPLTPSVAMTLTFLAGAVPGFSRVMAYGATVSVIPLVGPGERHLELGLDDLESPLDLGRLLVEDRRRCCWP